MQENHIGQCYLRGTAVNCPNGNCAPRPQLPCADVFAPTASKQCPSAVWTRDSTCSAGFAKNPPPKPFPEDACPLPVRETPSWSHFYTKSDHFAKTGSGQT